MDHPTNDDGDVADLIAQLGRVTHERDIALMERSAAIGIAAGLLIAARLAAHGEELSKDEALARIKAEVAAIMRANTNLLDA